MNTHRLFFALWPTSGVRNQCHSIMQGLPKKQGRQVHKENIHITLKFIGDVPLADTAALSQSVKGLRVEPFILTLDKLGYFPKPKVLWLGCHSLPSLLRELVEKINRAVTALGYAPEHQAYTPHVTLLRNSKSLSQACEFKPFVWEVDGFVLAQSIFSPRGVRYRVLQEFALND